MIEEATDADDLTRFERFKKWARENIVWRSAVAISVAGIITTVVMGARNAVKKGGRALGKFAKAVSKMGKKLGPLLSALGTLLSKIILTGSQGLLWLSQNLWVLAFPAGIRRCFDVDMRLKQHRDVNNEISTLFQRCAQDVASTL